MLRATLTILTLLFCPVLPTALHAQETEEATQPPQSAEETPLPVNQRLPNPSSPEPTVKPSDPPPVTPANNTELPTQQAPESRTTPEDVQSATASDSDQTQPPDPPSSQPEASPPSAENQPSGTDATDQSGTLAPSELPSPDDESDGAPLATGDIIPLPSDSDTSLTDDALMDTEFIPGTLAPPPVAPTVESEAERRRAENIRYREIRTRAEADPQLVSLRALAASARTLEDERAALRAYYRQLYKKIADLDPSLKEKARAMENAYIRSLSQSRLEPTIPLNSPPEVVSPSSP